MSIELPSMKYSLRFLIDGISDFLVYRVEKEDSERLKKMLAQPESKIRNSPFFFFSTKNGLTVALSVPDIHLVNFLWDPPTTVFHSEEEIEDVVTVYFRRRTRPYQTGISTPRDLGRLFFYLDSVDMEEEPFLYFDDEDGEEVALRPSQVVLLTAPSRFVEYASPPRPYEE